MIHFSNFNGKIQIHAQKAGTLCPRHTKKKEHSQWTNDQLILTLDGMKITNGFLAP